MRQLSVLSSWLSLMVKYTTRYRTSTLDTSPCTRAAIPESSIFSPSRNWLTERASEIGNWGLEIGSFDSSSKFLVFNFKFLDEEKFFLSLSPVSTYSPIIFKMVEPYFRYLASLIPLIASISSLLLGNAPTNASRTAFGNTRKARRKCWL